MAVDHYLKFLTRAYVKRGGPRRKGVNMDVILSPLSLMAASLLALIRGIAIKTLAHGILLHAPFGKQVFVSGEDCSLHALLSSVSLNSETR